MSFSKSIKFLKREKSNSHICSVPLCSVSGKFNSSVSFHRFPKHDDLRKIWLRNIRRDNLVIKKHTLVCSRHFLGPDLVRGGRSRRIRWGAVPVLFPWNDYSLRTTPPEQPRGEEPRGEEPRGEEPRGEDTEENVLDYNLKRQSYICLKIILPKAPQQCQDDNSHSPEPAAPDLSQDVTKLQQQVREELRRRQEEMTLQQTFGLQRFSGSDEDIRFFTRFSSYHHLLAFWRHIEPVTRRIVCVGTGHQVIDDPQSRLAPIDELFLFLVYVSLGLEERDLAEMFRIHHSTVSQVINTWVHFLYALLGAVPIWMSPEDIRGTMPEVFGPYSDTQVIIDCIELRCQTPPLQTEISSSDKSHTTMKAMVGVSPHGAVTFVSSLCSCAISNTDLFRQSGMVPLVHEEMAVMVDEAFKINTLVPCKVYRLPLLHKKAHLSQSEVTQDMDRLGIHVERVIRRIKENQLFESIVPLTMAGSINQLFTVACLLSNYQNKAWVKDCELKQELC